MWTDDQQSVIDARKDNILVSAAAGSGKTAVLVERIIQMITDSKNPIDIDSLLIVTFTEAAAAEMKERIAAALEKLSRERPEDRHLSRERMLIHNAHISTIHSFCTNVLRNYFYLIDLDPAFRVAEEAEIKMISQDVISSILEEHYSAPTDEFVTFIENFSNDKGDTEAEELILKLAGISESHVNPDKWFDDILEGFRLESIDSSAWFRSLLVSFHNRVDYISKLVQKAVDIVVGSKGPDNVTDILLDEAGTVSNLMKAEKYEIIYSILNRIEFKTVRFSKKDNFPEEKKDELKEVREIYKKLIRKIRDDYFSKPEEEVKEEIRACRGVVEQLIALTREYLERFEEAKREKNVIDFSDMEHLTLRILEHEEPCRELAEKFYEVMTDEYQDSNEVQETILSRVSRIASGTKNRFAVGDVKQSIYGFRLADPSIFMGKYHDYKADPDNGRCIELHKNFRSRKEIIDFTNDIMRLVMLRDIGGVEYDKDAELVCGADYYSDEKSVCGVDCSKDGEPARSADCGKDCESARSADCGKDSETSGGADFNTGAERLCPVKGTEIILIEKSESVASGEGDTEALTDSGDGKRTESELRTESGDRSGSESRTESGDRSGSELRTESGDRSGSEFRTESGDRSGNEFRNSSENVTDNEPEGESGDESENGASAEELQSDELEAEVISKKINELMNPDNNFAVFDKKKNGYRKICYSDIAILMRSVKGHAKVITDALSRAGIPSYTDAGTGYFDAAEVVAVLEFLSIIDNPKQDIPFASVLLSPIGGLNEEDISQIRCIDNGKNMFLYDAALTAAGPEKHNREIGIECFDKLTRFFSVYTELRDECRLVGIDVLISDIYRKTGYYNFVSASTGDSGRANLNFLRQKAESFEKTSYHGLFNFLRYIDRLKKYEVDYGEGVSSGADAVRIMTIHKSKGLEFPVVFLARCSSKINTMSESSKVVFHSELGLGPEAFDPATRIKTKTLVKTAIADRIRVDERGEELRVMYVALTRAREKLIITGVLRNTAEKQLTAWRKKAEINHNASRYENIRSAGSWLDLLVPAALEAGLEDCIHKETSTGLIEEETERKIDLLERAERLKSISDKAFSEEVEKYFNYRYPFEADINRKLKYSVSELKKAAMERLAAEKAAAENVAEKNAAEKNAAEKNSASGKITAEKITSEIDAQELYIPGKETLPEVELSRTDFEKIPAGDIMSASERGTAVHKIMMLLPYDGSSAKEIIKRLLASGSITPAEAGAAEAKKYDNFLASELGKRMSAAHSRGELFRERPFVLGVDFPQSADPALIQGIIDAYFLEEDGIVLVDYKTDKTAPGEEEELIRKYETQLDYYSQALERLVHRRVKEKIIYSFSLDKTLFL